MERSRVHPKFRDYGSALFARAAFSAILSAGIISMVVTAYTMETQSASIGSAIQARQHAAPWADCPPAAAPSDLHRSKQ